MQIEGPVCCPVIRRHFLIGFDLLEVLNSLSVTIFYFLFSWILKFILYSGFNDNVTRGLVFEMPMSESLVRIDSLVAVHEETSVTEWTRARSHTVSLSVVQSQTPRFTLVFFCKRLYPHFKHP